MKQRERELFEIKTIPPERILKDLDIPFVKRTSYIEAAAVWRGEKRPSVSIQQNEFGEWLWHDFGSGKGGSWIDLVMVLYSWDYITAVRFLREKYLLHLPVREEKRKLDKSLRISTVKILEVKEVSHPALLNYLRERRIGYIPSWLKEIHWQVKERKFFGVGVETVSGSWTIRNRLGKWNIREKSSQRHSYSLIEKNSKYLAVFEGLFDALSWEQKKRNTDILILNSVNNLKQAFEVLGKYEVIILGLDKDRAGREAEKKIKNKFSSKVLTLEFSSKDLNEALINQEHIKITSK